MLKIFSKFIILLLIAFFLGSGAMSVWAVATPLPDFNSDFISKTQVQSTKIYDRTGKVLLYDLHGMVKRTIVPFNEIPDSVKKATIAIEDENFYKHSGVQPTSMLRALYADITTGKFAQGGSTITMQLVKNTVLSSDKTLSRKFKEILLALKLERTMSKDDILAAYLNQIPYGGTNYGIQEASQAFFKKDAKNLTLAESAYLAAIPQAPTRYSPYGTHKDELERRKNLVLDKMVKLKFISPIEATKAKLTKVTFYAQEGKGIKAPHFVFFLKSYLVEKYGEDAVEKGGLKVISTLDYEMQKKAEEAVAKYGEINQAQFNANNAGMVGIDPKTGQILMMVGSRDYFNTKIDGNYNIATANRQPGSSFKPIVYATAFNKGYTPETVVFDLPTQFNTYCSANGQSEDPTHTAADCYAPQNYDGKYVGPITLKDALAQSRNVPAIKTLYLAGLQDSLNTAARMGITTLGDKNRYGLTLVLGGGEVSLLEMTGAYSAFANDGIKNKESGILRVEDAKGKVLEEFKQVSEEVLPANTARQISSILSDKKASGSILGETLNFGGRQVAAKTGTTNDYKDAWIIGYTPSLTVGAWAGNTDNKPMEKKVAGMIVAPMWKAFMSQAVATMPKENFPMPDRTPDDIKSVLRGDWKNGDGSGAVHSILYWVNKDDPRGATPSNPVSDPQFRLWETAIQTWARSNGFRSSGLLGGQDSLIPLAVNQPGAPVFEFTSPKAGGAHGFNDKISITIKLDSSTSPITKVNYFLNSQFIGSSNTAPYSFTLDLKNQTGLKPKNTIKAHVYDEKNLVGEKNIDFKIDSD